MAEYGKKTVAELTEILKSRGLSHTGKKAELIARLNENDKQQAEVQVEESIPEPAPAEAEPEADSTPVEPSEETGALAQTDAEAAATDGTAVTAPEAATYTLNLKASDLDSELAKRKARAERFGTGAPATDAASTTDATGEAEALKNLERAKRFGTENTAISKLDEALPTERVRGNKRKAEEATALDDPGLRRGFANRGRGRGGRGRGNRGGNRNDGRGPTGVSKPPPAYTSDKDRMAAEARRKKFATA